MLSVSQHGECLVSRGCHGDLCNHGNLADVLVHCCWLIIMHNSILFCILFIIISHYFSVFATHTFYVFILGLYLLNVFQNCYNSISCYKKYIKIEKIQTSPSNHQNATSVRSEKLAVLKIKLQAKN